MSQLPSSNQARLAGKSLNEMEASMGKSWNIMELHSDLFIALFDYR
jgi:hypothetical protein